jgi:hypothetical protein
MAEIEICSEGMDGVGGHAKTRSTERLDGAGGLRPGRHRGVVRRVAVLFAGATLLLVAALALTFATPATPLLPMAPSAQAAECEGDDCQGPAPAPDDPIPGTAVVEGPSNPPVRFPSPHHKKPHHKKPHAKKHHRQPKGANHEGARRHRSGR